MGPRPNTIGLELKCAGCKHATLTTERVQIDPWGELHYRQDHPGTELPEPFDRMVAYCSSQRIAKSPRQMKLVVDCEAFESRPLEETAAEGRTS